MDHIIHQCNPYTSVISQYYGAYYVGRLTSATHSQEDVMTSVACSVHDKFADNTGGGME